MSAATRTSTAGEPRAYPRGLGIILAVCGPLALILTLGVVFVWMSSHPPPVRGGAVQLANLRMAVWAYASEVRMGRELPPSRPGPLTPYRSGAESLCWHLLGPKGTGHTVTRHGVSSTVQPFYTATPSEVRAVWDPRPGRGGGNWMGLPGVNADTKGRVFVDVWSDPAKPEDIRPILYFAADPDVPRGQNPYRLGDNELILKAAPGGRRWAPADYAARFDAAMQYDKQARTYVRGFVLVSAGPDRQYFTEDDLVDFAEQD